MPEKFDAKKAAASLAAAAGPENVHLDEPMRKYTSFRIGGPADIFVTPSDADAVRSVVGLCRSTGLPYFIMGNGTNLLVRDGGIRGVVVNLSEKFNRFRIEGDRIEADAGTLLSRAANAAAEAGLTGMEFASGIPGTVGGAVVMNAGAYDGEMRAIVERTGFLDERSEIRSIDAPEQEFRYRSSIFEQNGGIVLSTVLRLVPGDPAAIRAKMEDFRNRRREKQPLELPSAGSVFKRPDGFYAGRMIEECGLKGCRMGGAQISEKHAGFIVNIGGATAADVLRLIEYAAEAVYNDFGIRLETEIRITGSEAADLCDS